MLLFGSSTQSPASFIKIISRTPLIFLASSTPRIERIFPGAGIKERSAATKAVLGSRSSGICPKAIWIAALYKLTPEDKG